MTKPTMPMPDTTVYGPDRFCAPKHAYFHENVLALNKAWATHHEAALKEAVAKRDDQWATAIAKYADWSRIGDEMKRYSAELNLMNEAAYMMENPLGKWCKFADHEAELYMARADKTQTLMEAERAMAQIREATAKVVAERDAAVADSERLEWALPILTGADSDDADKLAMKLALALMRGLDGRAAIDFARKEC